MDKKINHIVNESLKDKTTPTWQVTVDYNKLPHDMPVDMAKDVIGDIPAGWELDGMYTNNRRNVTNLCFKRKL